MNGQGMNIYHGLGYGVGSILSAKDLYSSGVELHKMKKSEKWKLAGVKVAKFMSNFGGGYFRACPPPHIFYKTFMCLFGIYIYLTCTHTL